MCSWQPQSATSNPSSGLLLHLLQPHLLCVIVVHTDCHIPLLFWILLQTWYRCDQYEKWNHVNHLSAYWHQFQRDSSVLSHDQDAIHVEKGCVEMSDFHMAALMFLTGHGIKAGTHVHVEITYFSTMCIIRTWEALGLPGPDDAPHCEMPYFHMGMGSCYNNVLFILEPMSI